MHLLGAIKNKSTVIFLPALLAAMLPIGLAAQTNNQPSLLTFGPWAACEAGMFPANSWYCLGVTPGSETYQLIIPHETRGPVAYRYSVTATLASGGTRTLSGVVERASEEAGYTFTILNFGGRIKDYSFQVQNLGIVSIKVREPGLPSLQ